MLDLNKLEKQLDEALENETEESLTEWLNRNSEELVVSKFNPKETTIVGKVQKLKAYLVKYNKGTYETFKEVVIFVTDDKEKAEAYVVKFNTLLDKLTEHYKKMYRFKDDDIYNAEYYSTKLCNVMDIHCCYVEEVEFRS